MDEISTPAPGPDQPGSDDNPLLRLVLLAFVVAALWGLYAMNSNASDGSPSVPLGPVGNYECQSAVSDAKSYVPDAIDEAQSYVDDVIAENPELAPYAADAKQQLEDSAPQVYENLDEAGASLGC